MTNIIAEHNGAAYNLTLDNITVESDTAIYIKFDTGANATVISIETLLKATTLTKEELIEKLMCRKRTINTFKSASGHDINTILCCAKNVFLSGVELDRLYFWLAIDMGIPKALLGDDFISCCSFSHNVGGDIFINRLDRNLYNQKFFRKNAISIDEIL